MARSVRRRSAPRSPAKTRSATISPRQTRHSNRSLTRATEPVGVARHHQNGLYAVDEQDDTIVVQIPSATKHSLVGERLVSNALHTNNENFHLVAPSDVSVDSEAYSDLEKDAICDNLEDINQNAQNLLALIKLAPSPPAFSMPSADMARMARRCEKYFSRLETDLEPCGRGPRTFLHVPRILRTLDVQRPLVAGTSAVFYRANLAIFVAKITEIESKGATGRSDLLQCLVLPHGFPQLFCDEAVTSLDNDDNFYRITADLGIAILTQYFIEAATSLIDDVDFEAGALLKTIFLHEDGSPRVMSFENVASETAISLAKRAVLERLQRIKLLFSRKGDRRLDTQRLVQQYPWNAFSSQTIKWARMQDSLLSQLITKCGGIDAIREYASVSSEPATNVSLYGDEIVISEKEQTTQEANVTFVQELDLMLDAHPEEDDESESDRESEMYGETVDEVSQNDGKSAQNSEARGTNPHRKHLILPEEQVGQDNVMSTQKQRQIDSRMRSLTPIAFDQEDDDQDEEHEITQDLPQITAGLHEPQAQPSRMTIDVVSALRGHDKDSDKENKATRKYGLLEKQPTATRVEFDDDTQEASEQAGKRRRHDSPYTDEEDGYEDDTRNAKRPRPHTGSANTLRVQQERDSRMFVSDTESDDVESVPAAARLPLVEIRRPPVPRPDPSTIPARVPSPHRQKRDPFESLGSESRPSSSAPPISSYAAQHQQVKNAAAINIKRSALIATRGQQVPVKATQVRTPWHAEEIESFVYYMDKFGPTWAKIKEVDDASVEPKLRGRNQVQLKDKARNMKLDYLKAEMELPWFLDSVTISKQHKEDLRKRRLVLPGNIAEDGD